MAQFRLIVKNEEVKIEVSCDLQELPYMFQDLELLIRSTRKDRFGYRAWRKSNMPLLKELFTH